jgi:hypothetical protein
MAGQGWVNLLNAGVPWQTTQGTNMAASGTATISPQAAGPQDFVLPGQPNGLQWYPGMDLRIRARGSATTGGTTNSTTLFLAIGVSGTLGTALCTTAAVVMGATTLSTLVWRLEANVACTALGSSGNTLVSDGMWIISDTTTPALITANTCSVGLPWVATAFNTYTGGTAIGLRATMTATFGSIQCNKFAVEQLN